MADRNRAAIDIELVHRNAQFVAAINHLHRKRFIELPQVNVADLQAESCQHLGNGVHRADAHLVRLAARHRKTEEATQGLQAFFLGQGFIHHHNRAAAVRELAGIAGRNHTAGNGRLDAADAFLGCAFTNAFVLADRHLFGGQAHHRVSHTHGDGDRRNLGIKQAGRQCSRGFLLAGSAVLVHLLARDAVTFGDLFGGLQHVPVNLWLVLDQPGIGQHVGVHFLLHTGDAFNAARHVDIGLTGNHTLRSQRNGLQTRRAKTVDGDTRDGDGATGTQGSLARDVGAGGAFRRGATHDHIINFPGFDAGALDRVLDRVAGKGRTMGHVEGALPAFGQRGAGSGNDYG